MSRVYRSAQQDGDDTDPRGFKHPTGPNEPANIVPGNTSLFAPAGTPRRRGEAFGPTQLGVTEGRAEQVRQQQAAEVNRLHLLAREHEMARIQAAHIPGAEASAELVRRLVFAHRYVGKPSLAILSRKTGYCKGTLSKVLNGKMHPTWRLVQRLGQHLRVPPHHVTQEWLPLWIAADQYRQATKDEEKGVARGTAAVPAQAASPAAETAVLDDVDSRTGSARRGDALTEETGYTCPICGCWVVNTAQHTGWHMQQEPAGRSAPETESTGASRANTAELTLLKEIFRTQDDN